MRIGLFQRIFDWVDDESIIMSVFKIYAVAAAIASPFIALYVYLGVF